jgi:hypothetical protein
MSTPTSSLGTLLRHLVETLDGAVEEAYARAGLDYRPRYTPVVRTLVEPGPSSIRTIATRAGTTHSAASQTVSQMTRQGTGPALGRRRRTRTHRRPDTSDPAHASRAGTLLDGDPVRRPGAGRRTFRTLVRRVARGDRRPGNTVVRRTARCGASGPSAGLTG